MSCVTPAAHRAALYSADYFAFDAGGEVVAYVPIAGEVPSGGRARMLEIPAAELAVALREARVDGAASRHFVKEALRHRQEVQPLSEWHHDGVHQPATRPHRRGRPDHALQDVPHATTLRESSAVPSLC